MEKDNTLLIVVIVLLALFVFGGFTMMAGFGGIGWMGQMHYGSQTLCSQVGGISCYWPAYGFSMLILVLILVILILEIIWLVKQIQGGKK